MMYSRMRYIARVAIVSAGLSLLLAEILGIVIEWPYWCAGFGIMLWFLAANEPTDNA